MTADRESTIVVDMVRAVAIATATATASAWWVGRAAPVGQG
jgi:hypothetical protein